MKTKINLLILIPLILVSACVSKEQKEKTISISGAFALYPLVVQWSEVYKKEHPEVRFNISGGGAGKGMADALSGAVDLGMFSREIAHEEKEQGVWWVGLTIDAVVPTISDQNPYCNAIKQYGMTRNEFRAVFIEGTVMYWDDLLPLNEKKELSIYTRSDACGAAGTWADYLGGKQENLLGIGIYGDPGLAEAVAIDPYGIGFNNTIFAYDIKTGRKRPGIEVIPIDVNENGVIDIDEDFYESFDGILKAIADGAYPSPPARELYFVAKEKPEKQATLDFIRWTLTHGQKYVRDVGYVPIDERKINEYLDKLK
ncbi:MAG: PstS family phosphate ABC transporter substrate-binding protein [Bacteroidetes bacterium]|nr:PstS family phosphate ABC transporter substrate-binding protein [Bacteroidota bacterium]